MRLRVKTQQTNPQHNKIRQRNKLQRMIVQVHMIQMRVTIIMERMERMMVVIPIRQRRRMIMIHRNMIQA